MPCNFCGSPYHWDEKCLMNSEFKVTPLVPLDVYIDIMLGQISLEEEVFDRWIQRLQMEMEAKR